MSTWNSTTKAATDAVRQAEAAEAWPPDKPIPYSLTPFAEATLTLDDPEAGADAW